MIDDKILLLSSGCDLFTKYTKDKTTKVYHIALESDNIKQHYGIYANGVLSESISIHDIQYLHTIRIDLWLFLFDIVIIYKCQMIYEQ